MPVEQDIKFAESIRDPHKRNQRGAPPRKKTLSGILS